MEIRAATLADQPTIEEIAERSLEASYSLSPQAIQSAVTQWYDEESFGDTLDQEDKYVLVVERDGEEVGFSESAVLPDGTADRLSRGSTLSATSPESDRVEHEHGEPEHESREDERENCSSHADVRCLAA